MSAKNQKLLNLKELATQFYQLTIHSEESLNLAKNLLLSKVLSTKVCELKENTFPNLREGDSYTIHINHFNKISRFMES